MRVARTPVTVIALQRAPAFDMRKGMRRAGKVELAVGNVTAIGLCTNRFEVCLLLLLLPSGEH